MRRKPFSTARRVFPALALPAALALMALMAPEPRTARAQAEPIIVGGSGEVAIEIDPRAIEPAAAAIPSGLMLPGSALSGEEPIRLTPPPGVEPIVQTAPKPVIAVPQPKTAAPKAPEALEAPVASVEETIEEEESSRDIATALPPAEPSPPEAPIVDTPIAEAPGAAEPVDAPDLALAEPDRVEADSVAPSVGETGAAGETVATEESVEAVGESPAVDETTADETAAAEEAGAETTLAALPADAGLEPLGEGQIMRIAFAAEAADMPADAPAKLASLAARLKAEEEVRLQLKAYAAGSTETASQARRLSLSRALNVRAYLIDQGVRSTRIDVRALGIPEDGDPPDRVDVLLLAR